MDPAALARLALLSAILAVSSNGAPPAANSNSPNPPPGSTKTTYIVQAGDTLYSIALQFNTTIAAIQQANNIANPNTLRVGQRLLIPTTVAQNAATPEPTARGPTNTPPAVANSASPTTNPAAPPETYIVRAGDTLASIAAQFGVPLAELVRVNNIADPNVISVGQRLVIPRAGTPPPLPDGVTLDPQVVRQGNTLVIKVTKPGTAQVLGKFDQQDLKFNPLGEAWVALVGISRCANYVGNYATSLTLRDALGNPTELHFEIRVNPETYAVQDLTLTAEMSALLDPAIMNAENARVSQVVSQYTPGQMWTGKFRLPLDEPNPRISTSFGERRSYNGGAPGLCGHEGTDYAVKGGTPVYAPADGVVALAAPLKVRGNVVFIDHGRGVFTAFYHLSEIDATNGQRVKAGDLVGKVGTTGFSTGDHLHWSMWVNGIYVDPDQWMEEEIP